MRYSAFRADTGDYDVFECAAERRGLADDLPPLALKRSTPIGVPSTHVGRPAPGKLTPLGRSLLPQGSVLPLSRAGLASLGEVGYGPLPLAWWGWALAGLALGYYLRGRRK